MHIESANNFMKIITQINWGMVYKSLILIFLICKQLEINNQIQWGMVYEHRFVPFMVHE